MTAIIRSSVCVALVAMLVAVSSPARAQADTIRAGIAGPLELRVGTDTSDTYAVRGGERRKVMTYVETVSETPEGYLIVGTNVRPDGAVFSVDSLTVSRGTLAPLRHADQGPQGRMSVRYVDGRLAGSSTDTAGIAAPVDLVVADGAFDYSLANRVINLLPLRAGYAGVVIAHDIRRGPVPLSFAVTGEEAVAAGESTTRAWVVEVDLGRAKARRWIAQDTRRDLRTQVSFPGGEMVAEHR
jgi:hypothetical protein